MAKPKKRPNPATQAFQEGVAQLEANPIFAGLLRRLDLVRNDASDCPPDGWLVALRADDLHIHPKRLATAAQWAHVLARATLYYAMEFWDTDRGDWLAWSTACDVITARFVLSLKLGQPPPGMALPDALPQWDERRWYEQFCAEPIPSWAAGLTLSGPGQPTMQPPGSWTRWTGLWVRDDWAEIFAEGIANSVTQAIEVAAGMRTEFGGKAANPEPGLTKATRAARDWFISSFPLLGAMVAGFEFVEDPEVCRREHTTVAAVDETIRTVYLNPAAGLTEHETRFVIAHEVLHVALRHLPRRRGRDAYLWNAACDFVINDWLIQMEVGAPPAIGMLYDPELRGLSAEEVYDRIANNIRLKRRLQMMRRDGDMLEPERLGPGQGGYTDLDEFCREQLGKGLLLHQEQGRGLLPAGLLEEINAVLQPPIGWEVKLARWFDHHFPPVETRRSWGRPSRRQSATPDIPRPHVAPDPNLETRTFGVVLDTSASMDRATLARALGSIASYAEAKDVPAVRLVCCDAAAYDLGYLPAGDIAGRVQLKGRGGTVLQPGIALLEGAKDFPKDGPILIITDGYCDAVTVRREHAFLLPKGHRLPFAHRGAVFEMS